MVIQRISDIIVKYTLPDHMNTHKLATFVKAIISNLLELDSNIKGRKQMRC